MIVQGQPGQTRALETQSAPRGGVGDLAAHVLAQDHAAYAEQVAGTASLVLDTRGQLSGGNVATI